MAAVATATVVIITVTKANSSRFFANERGTIDFLLLSFVLLLAISFTFVLVIVAFIFAVVLNVSEVVLQ